MKGGSARGGDGGGAHPFRDFFDGGGATAGRASGLADDVERAAASAATTPLIASATTAPPVTAPSSTAAFGTAAFGTAASALGFGCAGAAVALATRGAERGAERAVKTSWRRKTYVSWW